MLQVSQILYNLLKVIAYKGKSIAISTSKIKKIIAIKKKRIEKSICPAPIGSNPHSKGDPFSILKSLFIPTSGDRTRIIALSPKITIPLNKIKKIISNRLDGNQLYLLYYES